MIDKYMNPRTQREEEERKREREREREREERERDGQREVSRHKKHQD